LKKHTLQLPNFSIPFAIETDASSQGIGAVLSQQCHPLAFVSKALGVKNRGLSTYEKEYLAILMAVDQWRTYLQHDEFIIYTDQQSLSHLFEQKLNTPWQQKVFTKLLGLQYKIKYKKGIENGAADALSRRPHPDATVYSMSCSSPQWLSEVILGYSNDSKAQQLLSELALQPDRHPPYSL
jgi:ribonuclease HI